MEKRLILAGGCFWGVEAYYQKLKGIVTTNVGYANGNIENPTYEQVCSGVATHAEVVEVIYNSNEITLEKVLEHFFRMINPFSLNKQGNDIGIQYRSGLYYENNDDKKIIEEFIKKEQTKYNKKIVVEVEELQNYYLAENYHQDYLLKNPTGYCHIDMSLIRPEEMK